MPESPKSALTIRKFRGNYSSTGLLLTAKYNTGMDKMLAMKKKPAKYFKNLK